MHIPNNLEDFKSALSFTSPPSNWSLPLQCLWYDAKENWDASHNIAQDLHNDIGSWLHAYLHRKEGDQWNADYWYSRAGKKSPSIGIEEEFIAILNTLL